MLSFCWFSIEILFSFFLFFCWNLRMQSLTNFSVSCFSLSNANLSLVSVISIPSFILSALYYLFNILSLSPESVSDFNWLFFSFFTICLIWWMSRQTMSLDSKVVFWGMALGFGAAAILNGSFFLLFFGYLVSFSKPVPLAAMEVLWYSTKSTVSRKSWFFSPSPPI